MKRSQVTGIGEAHRVIAGRSARPWALEEHALIIDSWIEFSHKRNAMPIAAKALDDLSINALVRDYIQPTFSKG